MIGLKNIIQKQKKKEIKFANKIKDKQRATGVNRGNDVATADLRLECAARFFM